MNPRTKRPRMPVPLKYSALAANETLRGAATGIANESMNDRWLLARSTPPVLGTLSLPRIVGRQIAWARDITAVRLTQ